MSEQYHDCLVIGGGPAGLTAAIYLARFRLDVLVIHSGSSRAALIPCTRNHAGFPDGISGPELLRRMREQAARYGARLECGTVTRLEQTDAGFTAEYGSGPVHARSVLLATGLTNRRPNMAEDDHAIGLADGRIRYCPVCDGFEVTDKRVGVVGRGARAIAEATFLRAFTTDVAVIDPDGPHDLSAEDRAKAEEYGLQLVDGPCRPLMLDDQGGVRTKTRGVTLVFDSVYPALGSDVHNELARQVGADFADDGTLRVDSHQRTSIPRLFAAGDVVHGLDQISHAMGEGGVAATTIRNELAAEKPLLRV